MPTIKTLLHSADSLLITAGAGMGVDSGLPDFRGNTGMWQAYPELGRRQMDFTTIANPEAFAKNPRLAWGFYGHRLALYRATTPHTGFSELLALANHLDLPYFIFTSNVDGQFDKAGFNADKIYECHGSIHHLQCATLCSDKIWTADDLTPMIDNDKCEWLGALPTCPDCGGLARPNILMFGDFAWQSGRTNKQRIKLYEFLKSHQNPVVIELGAGTAIPTVRRFGERFAPRLIRINPRDDDLPTRGGVSLKMGARAGVCHLLEVLD